MNFDVKLSDCYQEFVKDSAGKQGTTVPKLKDLKNLNGELFDGGEDPADDCLFTLPAARRRIARKMKDRKLLSFF